MAIVPAAAATTYDIKNTTREDLLDVITMISPTDTPFFSSVPKGAAKNTLHEWPIDSLPLPSAENVLEEGDDPTYVAPTDRVRVNNNTQIITNAFAITETKESVDEAGMKSEIAYQMTKNLKAHKLDIEWAIFNNVAAPAAGAEGTPRRQRGILAYIAQTGGPFVTTPDHVTPPAAGASNQIVEQDLNAAMEAVWNQGGDPDTVFTSATLKRRITHFMDIVPLEVSTAAGLGVTDAQSRPISTPIRRADQAAGRNIKKIDVYENDFGAVRIIPDRLITTSGGESEVYVLDMSYWAYDFLTKPFTENLAKTGSSHRRWVYSEGCLVGKAPAGQYCFQTVTNTV